MIGYIYFTLTLRGIQFRKIGTALASIFLRTTDSKGTYTNFQAISTVSAGNLGTGTIAGIGVAFVSGGPGSLVWMWVMALFGTVLKYAGCFLGMHYRQRSASGEYIGGPMYYALHGLQKPFLATIFCIATLGTAFTTQLATYITLEHSRTQQVGI